MQLSQNSIYTQLKCISIYIQLKCIFVEHNSNNLSFHITYYQPQSPNNSFVSSKLKVCLVGVKTGRMKNRKRKISWKMLFSTIWLAKENRRDRNRGESFPSQTHFFNPPKSRGKCGEKSAMKALLHKYPLTCPSFMT